mgnify:CR=1 FL=1
MGSRRRGWLAATLLLVCWGGGSAWSEAGQGTATSTSERAAEVDALFGDWNRDDAPGAVVAVIRDGAIVHQRAYGMADLERSVALSTESVLEIGSISKQFTAMCVLLLELDGALGLDDDVREHLPEMPDYGEPITLRQLAHHTSGVRDVETLIPLAGVPWFNHLPMADQLALIARQEGLNFAPGSRFLYSNSGYTLLAVVDDRVSGMSLRSCARERISEPLGMRRTTFWDTPGQVVPDRALAYSPVAAGWRDEMWNLPFAGPAGLYTSVGDLARWDANFYDNRLGGGPELIRRMETSGTLDDGAETGYAMGLGVGELWGSRVVRHTGAWMGYRAGMMRFPAERLTVVVLSNAASSDVGAGDVARLYLPETAPSGPEAAGVSGIAPAARPALVALAPTSLAAVEGRYWAESSSLLRRIEVRDGALWYVRGNDRASELGALAPDRFVMLDAGPPAVEVFFERAGVGSGGATPTSMRVVQGDTEIAFERLPAGTPAGLEQLEGDYWSGELGRQLQLEVAAGELLVGWSDAERRVAAEPLRTDEYLVPAFVPVPWSPQDVVLEVERSADGSVTGLTLSCDMVRGVALSRN